MITYADTHAITRPAEVSMNQELRLCKKNKDSETRQGKWNKSPFLIKRRAQTGRQPDPGLCGPAALPAPEQSWGNVPRAPLNSSAGAS